MCIRDSGNSGTQRVEREYSTNQTVSSPRIPPIVIPDNRNYTDLLRSLSRALPSVSYTHLDVYKRQLHCLPPFSIWFILFVCVTEAAVVYLLYSFVL